MLNYAGEACEVAMLYSSFAVPAIFQDTPWSNHKTGAIGAQNSVGMWILRVTTNVQNLLPRTN